MTDDPKGDPRRSLREPRVLTGLAVLGLGLVALAFFDEPAIRILAASTAIAISVVALRPDRGSHR
jgi:hypothetical protein